MWEGFLADLSFCQFASDATRFPIECGAAVAFCVFIHLFLGASALGALWCLFFNLCPVANRNQSPSSGHSLALNLLHPPLGWPCLSFLWPLALGIGGYDWLLSCGADIITNDVLTPHWLECNKHYAKVGALWHDVQIRVGHYSCSHLRGRLRLQQGCQNCFI